MCSGKVPWREREKPGYRDSGHKPESAAEAIVCRESLG